MKKIMAAILCVALLLGVLGACGKQNSPDSVSVATIKGPSSLATLQIMDNSKNGKAKGNYDFTMVQRLGEAATKLTNGEVDIAALPTNVAATLNAKTGGNVQIIAIDILGVLDILTGEDVQINSVEDLKGKTIYSSGQGATPEFALNFILESYGLDPKTDVTINYTQDYTTLATQMIVGSADIALVAEPFATQVVDNNPKIKKALDMTKEWEKVTHGDSVLTMGCLAANRDYVASHPQEINTFLDEYKKSVAFVNGNTAQASQICEKYGIMGASIAMDAIPNCNVVDMEGSEMQQKADGFLKILYDQNPQSIGGKLPDETFYYRR